MNIYIRVFLVGSLSAGIYAALRGGLEQGIVHGVVVGGILALVIGTMQRFAPRGTKGIHETQILEVPLAYNKAFDSCQAAIAAALKGKILAQDRASGLIEARTGLTWKSYGEDILMTIREVDENHTQIRVASRPTLFITWVDYGKNSENIEKIIAYLKEDKG